jgi:ABC-type phosphate/phosphonate transport system substrate-binding protein
VKAAWKRVLQWAVAQARLDWDLLDYEPPAPLSELWARSDLGCAMMCGLPYSQRRPQPELIAAPVPSPARYAGRPIYYTDIVARADSPFRTLEDTFGATVGYTLKDSMSGCVALRKHLLPYRLIRGPRLYHAAVGNLVNPKGVIDALNEGCIDVGPLDSYYHDLLKHNDPQVAAKLRVVASTAAAPIPPLVATAELVGDELARLRAAILAAGETPELQAERSILLLQRFATPDAADYRVFDAILAESRQYSELW